MEDRRVRKDLQETYTKLVDVCLLVGRATDTTWIRRGHSSLSPNVPNGKDSPITRSMFVFCLDNPVVYWIPAVSDTRLDEKLNASTASLSESLKPTWGVGIVDQVSAFATMKSFADLSLGQCIHCI